MENIDMPFTKHGIRPDIIMNPNAVPSRMTIGQLWECLLGKIGAISGMNMDGTAFEDYDLSSLKDMLEKLGYQRECEEMMYNGMTGKMMKHVIFIGPTYYQRLKHMVQDKMHCLTPDHLVMTNEGWKPINEITLDHNVAILENGYRTFEKPTNIHHYGISERTIINLNYSNHSYMQRITEEHRVYVSVKNIDNDWEAFKLIKIMDLIKKLNPMGDTVVDRTAGILDVRMKSGCGKIIDGPIYYSKTIENTEVYCLSVKGERFIVKNNLNKFQENELGDSGIWTGNSRARGPVTILTHQAPEGRWPYSRLQGVASRRV